MKYMIHKTGSTKLSIYHNATKGKALQGYRHHAQTLIKFGHAVSFLAVHADEQTDRQTYTIP